MKTYTLEELLHKELDLLNNRLDYALRHNHSRTQIVILEAAIAQTQSKLDSPASPGCAFFHNKPSNSKLSAAGIDECNRIVKMYSPQRDDQEKKLYDYANLLVLQNEIYNETFSDKIRETCHIS